MERCVVGSILSGGPIELIRVSSCFHFWCNNCRGMMHMKDYLLLIVFFLVIMCDAIKL